MLAIEKTPVTATKQSSRSAVEVADKRFDIAVVFTSVEATLVSLKTAGELANSLGARITLLVPHVVSYPLPVENPSALLDFSHNRFRVMTSDGAVGTSVNIYLCRDRYETLTSVLKPDSIVVLGGPKRWWPTKDELLAGQLRRAGYEVIFKETPLGLR